MAVKVLPSRTQGETMSPTPFILQSAPASVAAHFTLTVFSQDSVDDEDEYASSFLAR